MNRPNLFIVGQLKSGTTALHYFLDQHPEIYMSREKEPHYFSKDFHTECDCFHKHNAYFRYREEEDYLRLFSDFKEAKVVGESSTSYLNSRVAAGKIYTFNPDAKIIIMLRNPADFIFSFHNFLLTNTYEDVEDVKTALALEEKRRQGECFPARIYLPSSLYYSDMIKYYEKVKRYYDLFDESNIKVIIFENFKENNYEVYKDTLKFLGVNPNFVPNFKMVNVKMSPRNKKLNFLAQNPYLIKAIRGIFPQRFYSTIKQISGKVLWEKNFRQPLDSLLREELMERYKPEIIKISELLSTDLEKRWCQC